MEQPTVLEFRTYFGYVFNNVMDYPDSMVQQNLDDASIEVSPCIFGKHYRRAIFYLTAHFLTLFKEMELKAKMLPAGSSAISASKGVIASTSVGDLSLTKEMPSYEKSSDDKFLASTVFGQEFIRLRNKMSRGTLLANKPITFGGCL